MTIPGQTFSLPDPGLATVSPANVIPIFAGYCSSGTALTCYTFSSIADLVATMGQGQTVEAAAYALAHGGGPVRVVKTNCTTAASNGAVTKTAVGTSTGTVTVAGSANDDYEVIVEITATGTLGAGRFRYSLDDGYAYSPEILIPSGGTYAITNTGLTLTFVPGLGAVFFEDGDMHSFDSVAAMWAAADVNELFTGCLDALALPWRYLVLCGEVATASGAATIFAALNTKMAGLATAGKFRAAMMGAGNDVDADIITAWQSTVGTAKRILVAAGDMDVASAKAMPGWATPRRPTVNAFALRAMGPAADGWGLISTDLKRVRGGPVPSVVTATTGLPAISHDERRSETMDVFNLATLRSYTENAGAFVTNGRVKVTAGSDYEHWQRRVIMDVACEATHEAQELWIGEGVRTNADGTIDERDAVRIEASVTAALRAQLTQPRRADGQPGHVSAVAYTVDRAHNILGDETLVSTVSIRPLGYPSFISTSLGYSVDVVTVA